MCEDDYDPDYDFDEDLEYGGECFANSGSALRCASKTNPRNLSCPTCGAENVLTPRDVQLGYQCDHCADAAEGRGMQY